jgi:hypothetical protein
MSIVQSELALHGKSACLGKPTIDVGAPERMAQNNFLADFKTAVPSSKSLKSLKSLQASSISGRLSTGLQRQPGSLQSASRNLPNMQTSAHMYSEPFAFPLASPMPIMVGDTYVGGIPLYAEFRMRCLLNYSTAQAAFEAFDEIGPEKNTITRSEFLAVLDMLKLEGTTVVQKEDLRLQIDKQNNGVFTWCNFAAFLKEFENSGPSVLIAAQKRVTEKKDENTDVRKHQKRMQQKRTNHVLSILRQARHRRTARTSPHKTSLTSLCTIPGVGSLRSRRFSKSTKLLLGTSLADGRSSNDPKNSNSGFACKPASLNSLFRDESKAASASPSPSPFPIAPPGGGHLTRPQTWDPEMQHLSLSLGLQKRNALT